MSNCSIDQGFESYLDSLAEALGHSDRVSGLKGYCQGLMLPLERKSVEPMAAHLDPRHVRARHQALHHFVSQSEWSDAAVLAKVRDWVVPRLVREHAVYWIIDDSGIRKKGRHSVGVARQYCGQLGKQDNCQVAVSLSLATDQASLPIAWQLYLPEAWAEDAARRRAAGVPAEIAFQTKPEMALAQVQQAVHAGLPVGVVLADAAYGTSTSWRETLDGLSLQYVVGVISSVGVWAPGTEPRPPKPRRGIGRPRVRRHVVKHQLPVSVKRHRDGVGGSPLPCRAVARRDECTALFAVRRGPASGGPRRPAPCRPACRAMVADRMAARRRGAQQILAVQPAGRHLAQDLGDHGQGALAHRARLSGAQARVRADSIRRPRLARVSSSRHTLYRRLRLLDRSASARDAPKKTLRAAKTCLTPSLPPARAAQRAQRHVANSIATLRWLLAHALARHLRHVQKPTAP
jgi:hypothetical protein